MGSRRDTAERLELALQMQYEGIELMRENLRRAHPEKPNVALDALLQAWLLDRPADAPGRPVTWPRRSKRPKA